MKKIYLIFALLIGFSTISFAQKQVRKDIREGNKSYRKGDMADAELDYRKALEGNARSIEAAYNLGNTLYMQGKRKESLEQYQVAVNSETDKMKLAMAWHNIGDIFMSEQDYQKSINAFKNALRNNPRDEETRYNLALAQKLLENQENQDQNQDQDQQQDQQQQEQQQDQKQDQQEQKQDQQQEQQEQQQQNQDQMSKQNADQILDALMQDEKNTQERVKAEQMQQQKQRKTDKNW